MLALTPLPLTHCPHSFPLTPLPLTHCPPHSFAPLTPFPPHSFVYPSNTFGFCAV